MMNVQVPVVEVCLLEDRAQVTRRARLELAAGRQRLSIDGVAPILADKTLSISLAGLPGAEVIDVRVRRTPRLKDEDRPRDLAAIEGQIRDLEQKKLGLEQRRAVRQGASRLLADTVRCGLSEMAEDAAWGQASPDAWAQRLDALQQEEAGLRLELLVLAQELRALQRHLNDLQRQRGQRRRPDASLGAAVELDLSLPRPGSLDLTLEYVVPGACWRPRHRARLELQLDEPRVVFNMDGCVWQNTGEDWQDVRLRFSTQRLSLGSEPPLLMDDMLAARVKHEVVDVAVRDQQIHTAGLGADVRAAEDLPGIDDGGQPVALAAAESATVPSDGRPHRVPVLRFEVPAQVTRVVMAERAAAAIRRCELKNGAPHPLLAGPVDLELDAGPIGRTTLKFVAPGEIFALGFGPDPAIRVRRTVEQVEQKPGVMSRWLQTDNTVDVYLSNIGTEDCALQVVERMPVSEVEQVKVELDRKKTRDSAQPDDNGHLRWNLIVPGDGTEQVKLAWSLQKKRDVTGV